MNFKIFLFAALLAFLLSLCHIDARSVKNKGSQENIIQTTSISTKRDSLSPPSSDAGGIMQRLLKGYLSKHHGKKDPIQSPTAPSPPPPSSPMIDSDASDTNEQPGSNTNEGGSNSTNTMPNSDIAAINEGLASVHTTFDALAAAVRNDDSIYGEISKNLTLSAQLLDQVQKKFDPKNIIPSLQDFAKLVDTIEGMSAAVVEQNDDGRLGKLLQALADSLHQLALAFQRFVPETSHTGTSLPDLSGLDSAITGGQEA